ncbi:3'-5' RNA helicase YTHDC2-like [Dendronephthya gigantea]|uniref:3'-5' RNA helicase YTHDC2-like n=1 Tax=Dendronephthya gigantea TaxID=151771 RepID=UPI00106CCEB0|nr:3'-5' RNA helicase YTHDC2-like [Dendronephthya gigantea]
MADSSSNRTSSANGSNKKDIFVKEELKIAVKLSLDKFRYDEDRKEMEFPSSFTSTERAYIHRLCQGYGLITKSKGCGSNRHLTVRKSYGEQTTSISGIHLLQSSYQQIEQLLQRFPITNKERQDLTPKVEKSTIPGNEASKSPRDNHKFNGRINTGPPLIPPSHQTNDFTEFRQNLPIAELKDKILNGIDSNQVLIISGETGSGKTTQVPQYIIESCCSTSKPCRIICTQPRRISAISVAERVAAERGERCGQTVGYQIRLDSRTSPKTVLTYCTNGILLRTLISGDGNLSSVTHVIVDEIHERDRFSDFLLISLRDLLSTDRNIKIILMSAAIDIKLFTSYFNGCPVINVPGRCFDVNTFFLEDVLKFTGYQNKRMSILRQNSSSEERKTPEKEKRVRIQEPEAKILLDAQEKENIRHNEDDNKNHDCDGSDHDVEDDVSLEELEIKDNLEEEEGCNFQEPDNEVLDVTQEMDAAISDAFLNGSEDSYAQILHLIMNEGIDVDYRHSETKATSLMVCAGRGSLDMVEQLLNLGANPCTTEPNNSWNASLWARNWNHEEVAQFIQSYVSQRANQVDDAVLEEQSEQLNNESKELLSLYHKTFNDDKIDLSLIFNLLKYICGSGTSGAVLVFLSGYDDIITLRDQLTSSKEFGNTKLFHICCLHSSMQPSEQRKAFRKMSEGTRKIILATNIAETSVTIDDVVYVIDSAKVKEKSFDALSSVSSLETVWISKASALQRRGRAGRCSPGVCYHLCSRVRYNSFQDFQIPELLRFPLQELCLHTKRLAGPSSSIAEFLSRAPEPPPYLVLRNAVDTLKKMDALDQWEELTDLGRLLAEFPVEPRLGKMILFSVVLKCVDPVVVVSCAMAYKDPFILPVDSVDKRSLAALKKRLAGQSYSDQLVVLKIFRGWQKAHTEGWDKNYCKKNFLAPGTMEMMAGMRSLILGQLKSMGFIRQRGSSDMRDLNTNSGNWAIVKAALCAGLYPNLVYVDKKTNKLATTKEKKIRLHHSTTLMSMAESKISLTKAHADAVEKLPSEWLFYEEMTRAAYFVHVKSCSVVSPLTVALFSGPCLSSDKIDSRPEASRSNRAVTYEGVLSESSDSESEGPGNEESMKNTVLMKIHDFVQFSEKPELVLLVQYLRHKLQALIVRRLRSPSRPLSQVDETVLRTIVNVLTIQEEALGINQQFQKTQRTWKSGNVVGRIDSKADEIDFGGRNESRGRGRNISNNTSKEKRRREPARSLNFEAPSKPQDESGQKKESQYRYDVRYFIMKCNNQRNVDIAMSKGIWATTQANEKKLNKAFKESRKVILIFSVQGSGHFQGYAHMTSLISREKCREFGSNLLTGSFTITWLKCDNIPFQHVHHLLNPWNDNKKVQISRDGQELEPNVGEALCKAWSTVESNKPHMSRYTQPSKQPSEQSQVQPPSQWHSIPTSGVPVTQYPHSAQAPILFAAHPASMPIPVPIPAHGHGPTMMIPQQAYPQPHMQATLTYSAQPIAMQPSAGYPSNPPMAVEPQPAHMGVMQVIGPEDYMQSMQPN